MRRVTIGVLFGWCLGFVGGGGVCAERGCGPSVKVRERTCQIHFRESAVGADPQTLNAEAARLAENKQWDKAIARWLEALPLVKKKHAHILHKNMGQAYREWGKMSHAWYHLVLAEKDRPGDTELAGWRAEVETELEKKGYCRVSLTSSPPGATVSSGVFGPEKSLPTPLDWWFPEGTFLIVFEKPGHLKTTRSLDTTKCSMKTLTVELEPVPYDGLLHVAGLHPGDSVLVNGGKVDVSTSGLRLPAGSYQVEVVRADGSSWRKEVVVRAGETASVLVPGTAITLDGPAEDTGEWWPYALIGAGGACIVAGVVTFLTALNRLDDINTKYSITVGTLEEKWKVLEQHDAEVSERVTPLEVASYVLWGVGLTSAGIGTWRLLRGPQPNIGASSSKSAFGQRYATGPLGPKFSRSAEYHGTLGDPGDFKTGEFSWFLVPAAGPGVLFSLEF